MKRVVITKVGVITPNGNGLEEFSKSLSAGRSGLSEIDRFDSSTMSSRIVGQVRSMNKSQIIDRYPGLRDIHDEKVFLGLHAFLQVTDSGSLLHRDCAVNLGSSIESFHLQNLFVLSPHKFDLDVYVSGICNNSSPHSLTQVPLDFLGHFIKKQFGVSGPNYLNCSACTASTQAIGHSFHMIRDGRFRQIVTGGFDSMLTPLGLGGFSRLGALNTENELKEKSIRPFDLTRQGTVLGEGAAVLVLEELEYAKERNAEILAEIIGYASSSDSYRLTEPDPDGAGIVLSMRKAFADAGIGPDSTDYINAHGTGTPANDRVETAAIRKVFGKRAYDIPVSSIKSMIGHLIGASGAVEIAGVIAMLNHGFISPTINLEYEDPECDLDYVPNVSRKGWPDVVLKNSMGFGGQNASILLRRFG